MRFAETPDPYRKVTTYWVISAKQPATRARRLSELVRVCESGRRLLK